MRRRHIIILSVLVAIMAGCSSPVNTASLERKGRTLVTKWDGGAINIRIEKKGPRIYEIRATGAPATSMNKAIKAWREAAAEIAGSRGYTEEFKTRTGYPDNPHPNYVFMEQPDNYMVEGEIVIDDEQKKG